METETTILDPEANIVHLSDLDWIRLNGQFSDILLSLNHMEYENPAHYDEMGTPYLKTVSENLQILGALAASTELDGVVSPSPLASMIENIEQMKIEIETENQNKTDDMLLLSTKVDNMNESLTLILESLEMSETTNTTSSVALVEEVSGVKEIASNALQFFAWTVTMAVVVAVTYYLYKKVIMKWWNYFMNVKF